MASLDWQAWVLLGVILSIGIALLRDVARPDLIFLGGLGMVLLTGIITPEEAFAGFSNSVVLTIGALFVIAAGVQRTQALASFDRLLFTRSKRVPAVMARLMVPTALLSSILNNTPIVAMLMPRVQQWGRRAGLPVSKLLIPLSYAAIIGGMITLIGTSTNIIVSGLLVEAGHAGFGLFDLAWVGLPALLLVVLFFFLGGHRLLPDRGLSGADAPDGLNECLFELRVRFDAPAIGRTIDEAGLRALGGAYLTHIRRQERLLPATPGAVLQGGDVLAFVGDPETFEQLLARPGLERLVEAIEPNGFRTMPLYEAVVADSSSLVGKTLKEAHFRDYYGGVVLGIQRNSERLHAPLGRVPIKTGDLLLVEAHNGFAKRWNASRDEFYLVAPRRSRRMKPQPRKAPVALAILLAMIVLMATGWLPLVTATFAAALAMIVTRCIRGAEARKVVDMQVLVVIAAALGLGKAIVKTGLAGALANGLLAVTAGLSPLIALALLYLITNVLTELITHKAAAVLMFPIALAAADPLGLTAKAAALVITVGAAASFMTPIGYQTNLMVMAAGGYRFSDYFKVGLPVNLIVMTVAVLMIYLVWT